MPFLTRGAEYPLFVFELLKQGRMTFEEAIYRVEKARRIFGPDDITGAAAAGFEKMLRQAQRDGML